MEIKQTYYTAPAAEKVLKALREKSFNVTSEQIVSNGFHGTRVTAKAQGWNRTDEAYLIMNQD